MDIASQRLAIPPTAAPLTTSVAALAAGDGLARARAIAARAGRRAAVFTALVAGDLAIALSCEAAALRLLPALGLSEASEALPIPAAGCLAAFLALNLYAEWGLDPVARLRLRGVGIALFACVSLTVAAGGGSFSLWVALEVACVGLLMFVVGHYGEELLRGLLKTRWWWGVPTALIGAGPASRDLALALLAHPEFGLRPIGLIGAPDGADPAFPLPLLGDLGDAPRLCRSVDVAIAPASENGHGAHADLLRLPFRHVVISHGVGPGSISCPRIRALYGAIGFDVRRDIYRRSSLALKRGLDCLMVAPMLLAAAPIVLILAIAIKSLSPGPVFFRQVRVGRNGRTFSVLKLRTMYVDAERRLQEHLLLHPEAQIEWSRFFKLRDDPRTLPGIGAFMRRTSLDELPQLLNVALGQMSLVGPRPFPDYHLQSFDKEFQELRSSVPPGLTGFWQISSRSDGDLAVQQMQDSFYITNWSLWFDLYIIFRTPLAVLGAKGAR
ncbi:sugar transferase [Hansschlegelia zhihuaiae]|uniref:Sugar transferase n=1 Tax=Hansschlegelia zhihuaiae TaxID=405005 RepID=A0A4Q0MCM8_9HYPH|nr:sugar transferase [Hansschlegelia zhihuaiae]RXF70954.1 sugar transferase [Hansschlegelia zhihuaiae]